jgi:hypothetical protein
LTDGTVAANLRLVVLDDRVQRKASAWSSFRRWTERPQRVPLSALEPHSGWANFLQRIE